jgi:rare lipoprotein A
VRSVARRALPILFAALLVSCSRHHNKEAQNVPPPPPPAPVAEGKAPVPATRPEGAAQSDRLPAAAANDADLAEPSIPAGATPIQTETGLASWYGPPYHNRVGSNGEVYNMHAMTAAHRTLPLGSIVRVTNLKTGHAALVRITDRGPFIPGRILDLSLAAARKLDVYSPGTAEVRVDLMEASAPLGTGGKWAVQIGAFAREHEARQVAEHLTRRYRAAKVLCFASPAGDWWVRVRVQDDDHKRAQQVTAETATPEGAVFLVRLD